MIVHLPNVLLYLLPRVIPPRMHVLTWFILMYGVHYLFLSRWIQLLYFIYQWLYSLLFGLSYETSFQLFFMYITCFLLCLKLKIMLLLNVFLYDLGSEYTSNKFCELLSLITFFIRLLY